MTKNNSQKGFLLFELLIAVTIFTIVVTIAVSSLVHALAASRKIQAQNIVIGNLDLALENMARNIRLGYNFHCGDVAPRNLPLDCPSGAPYFTLTGSDGVRIAYRLSGTTVQRSDSCGGAGICSQWTDLTSPEITVTSLTFYVDGTSVTDLRQPRVLINVQGTAGFKQGQTSTFSVQTSVTQRIIDS